MENRTGWIRDNFWNILAGVIVILILLLLIAHPRRDPSYDMRYVEIRVDEKEITDMDDEAVYLIHTTDQSGKPEIFEITDNALGERFSEAEVYKEIRKGKYYKLRIAEPESFGSHYPSICGAVTLIDGFTQETTAEKTK